ncbi:ABC transporter substrate-binding protein [Foetidibacter luteolus]|uniref:ABC transporter substrate-binding protein n=1 Tax=Foetidibacter luteolus TaxID=2608880 RepID=UPI00129B0A2D|nr:ABC transporter substrate-binding protein [Foetidibacter luteolus]
MKKIALHAVLFHCCLLLFFVSRAQTEAIQPKQKVAVLAPLYLDSAFDGSSYKLSGNNIPRYILPGLDFYHGIMDAVDSLKQDDASVDVFIYDTKRKGGGIAAVLKEVKAENAGLIIAAFNNAGEQKIVSDFSLNENIPVISATYPNDANLSGNPFFVVVNSTINTHVSALYNYLQQNYSKSKIIYLTKPGAFETRIKNQFASLNKKIKPLSLKTVSLTDNFEPGYLLSLLDSTRQNVVVCGSLSESFGVNIVRTISAAKSYKATVIGAPTWESQEAFDNPDCFGVEIVYSTPYNYSRKDKIEAGLINDYRAQHFGRPSDMYFKGFECMYHFSKLLVKHRTNLLNNISEPSFKVMNEFYFEPVRLTEQSFAPDYLENKKIYFVKKQDGVTKSVN